MWDDVLFAKLNGIPDTTYRINKLLPLEQKLKLPAMECICALKLKETVNEKKSSKRNCK